MIRFIARFLKIFLCFSLAIAIVGTVLFFYYRNDLKETIVGEINKYLTAEVHVDEVQISFIHDFPHISIIFYQVDIENPESKEKGDQLLQAKTVSISFNILDIINQKYYLNKVLIKDADLNLWINNDGVDNFHIWKTDEGINNNSSFNLDLEKVILKNVTVSYRNQLTGEFYSFLSENNQLSGQFSDEAFTLLLKGDNYIHVIKTGAVEYLKNTALTIKLTFGVDRVKKSYTIKNGEVKTDKLAFTISGNLQEKSDKLKEIHLNITGKKSALSYYLSVLPYKYKKHVNDYEGQGIINVKTTIHGLIGGGEQPTVTINFNLENGTLARKNPAIAIENVNLSGSFINKASEKKIINKLTINNFSATLLDGEIQGSGAITGFVSPLIELDVRAELGLNYLHRFLTIDTIASMNGKLDLDFIFNGKVGNINQLNPQDFVNSRTSGTIKLINAGLRLKQSPHIFQNINGSFNFSNNDLLVNTLTGDISDSDFQINGYFRNMLAFIMLPGQKLFVDADFTSNTLNLNSLLLYQTDGKDSIYRLHFPDQIAFDLTLKIKKFIFKKFNASEITGNITLKDKILHIDNLSFRAMEGEVVGAATIKEQNNKFLLSCSSDLKNVNIRTLFYQFENFGQTSLVDKNINGKVNAHIDYSSDFNNNLSTDLSSIRARANITIESGELINYSPLKRLSSFLRLDDLSNIQFSRLQNNIEIRDKKIIIPEMEIMSSSLNLNAFGTHTFDNMIDYHFNLLLSEVLSKKVKNQHHDELHYFIEEEGHEGMRIFLSVSGTVDVPVIKYDTRQAKEKIFRDFKEEKTEIRSAIEKEFPWMVKDSLEKLQEEQEEELIKKQEQGQFIIEWENDTTLPDTSLNKKAIKKIKGSKFKITWDEDTLGISD